MTRRYSADEDARMLKLYGLGVPITVIAEQMGRSRNSVECRFATLGVQRKRSAGASRSGYRWNDEELAILRRHKGEAVERIAQILPGRSAKAIRQQLIKMFGEPVREEGARPIGVPYRTASGVWAITLASGPVPYVHSLYGHL